jgi:uncharacterized protein (TIGR02599 family)
MNSAQTHKAGKGGFTLVEIMVSVAILAIILTFIAELIGQAQRSWSRAGARVSQFREARKAFDWMVRNLGQATINPSVHYVYAGGEDPRIPSGSGKGLHSAPDGYGRFSELQFICGRAEKFVGSGDGKPSGHAVFFQAPLGATDLDVSIPTALTPVGFFVKETSDTQTRPDFLGQTGVKERKRHRLFLYKGMTEHNTIYDASSVEKMARNGRQDAPWIGDLNDEGRVNPLADNIVLLVIAPRLAEDGSGVRDPYEIASDYEFNSASNGLQPNQAATDYQIPPLVDITMVALDESSAARVVDESIDLNLSALFKKSSKQSYRDDIKSLQENLREKRLDFRIFSTTVPLRNSRW